jgi:hypothetical protein
VKTRRQGNAIVLTVPTRFGIDENVDYIAVKGPNESITFIKKEKNIFDEAAAQGKTLDVTPGFPDDKPVGGEMI